SVRTSVSAPFWPGSRCGSSSRRRCGGSPTSRSTARSSGCNRTSNRESSTCRSSSHLRDSRRVRGFMAARPIAWVAALGPLLLGVLVSAPFWLTTTLVRLALHRLLPEARLELGAARLAPAGRLVVENLRLNDSTSPEPLPLVTVTDVTVSFDWRE